MCVSGGTGRRIFGRTSEYIRSEKVRVRKRAITQVKVQSQHFRPDEATSEDEQNMKEVYPELFLGEQHRDDVDFQEGEM